MKKKVRGHSSRPNLMDVASYAGVSAMTVSRALKTPDKVAESTLEKIHSAVEALGYVPNLAANTLRNERSGVIVAIVPTIESSIFSDTIQGVSDILEPAGYHLLLGCASYSADMEEGLVKAFLGHRPDGIILTGTLHTDATRRYLMKAEIPVVEMWDIADRHIDMAVGFDNVKAGYDLARYVLECGYKKVGYVAGSPAHEERENRAAKRSAGVAAAFRDAGIGQPARINVRDPLNYEESGVIAADFFESQPGMEAIICAFEITGVGAMVELQRRGWRIPDQIAIAALGDVKAAALVSPGLTAVDFLGYDIGRESAKLLLARLDGAQTPSHRQSMDIRIVVRGSTKAL